MAIRMLITNADDEVLSVSPDLWDWLAHPPPPPGPLCLAQVQDAMSPDMVMRPMPLDDGTTAQVITRGDSDLARENRLLRETLETMDAAIVVYDCDLRYLFGNQGYHDVFPHLPPDRDLIGRHYAEILTMSIHAGANSNPRAMTDTEAYVAQRVAEVSRRENSVRNSYTASTQTWWQIRATWTPSGSRVSLRVDITQIKRLEADLISSQRAKTVGRISAGVAHHFNNLLTVVQGNLEMAASSPDLPQHLAARIRRALSSTEEGGRLTRQLLTFAHRDITQPRRIELQAFLSDIHDLLQGALGADITFQLQSQPASCWVLVDPAAFEAAMVNLILNARDAIIARSQGAARPLGFVQVRVTRAEDGGGFAVITVADDGEGMTTETASEAFEPFFSTKPPGVASGLGLSQVHGFATGAGGTAAISSVPGQGTEVEIRLPIAPP